MLRTNKTSKYGNRRVFRYGQWFDSEHEALRFFELSMLQRSGKISDLQTQVPFELIPAQREPDIIGPRGGVKKGRCLEQACMYYADFVYKDQEGRVVVEDAKSPATRTKDYKIKKKLMLYVHHIQIVEV
jgi:hypothetical protein